MTVITERKTPRVFISYCWTSPSHEDWVVELATNLRDDGIDVVLDKWDLKPGNDSYYFMETNVRNVDKVLIVCDSGYKKKADDRKGGVGTEAQIISPEIYSDLEQEKFIPIIADKPTEGENYIPTFIKGRIYIDLSTDETYEAEYEKLLRHLYERPSYRKPALGKPPDYLFEEEKQTKKFSNLNTRIKKELQRDGFISQMSIETFLSEFISNLECFRISDSRNSQIPFDEILMDNIKEMTAIRNDFIDFVEHCCIANPFPLQPFIDFFEAIISYTEPPDGCNGYFDHDFDNYRFINHELFLYFVTIVLKKKRIDDLSIFLNTEFFYRVRSQSGLMHAKYGVFRDYPETFNRRKERINSNLISIHADCLIKRANYKYTSREITHTDLLLYYLGNMTYGTFWFPVLYIYARVSKIEILERLRSKRFFEHIRKLFGVETKNELIANILKLGNQSEKGYSNSFESIPTIQYHIEVDEIGTID